MVNISTFTNRVWGFLNSPFRYNLGVVSASSSVSDINFVSKVFQIIDTTSGNPTISTTQSLVSEVKVPLRPDNVGSLDIQFLKSRVNGTSNINVLLDFKPDNYVRANVETGFECNPNLTFSNINNIDGKVGLLVGNTAIYRVNDEIGIKLKEKFDNPEYEGYTMISGFSASNVITNIDWGRTSSSTQSGEVYFLKRYTGTSSNRILLEGAVQYDNLLFNLETKYVWRNIAAPNWTTSEYLTNYPYNYNNDNYTKKVYTEETPYETIFLITDGLASFGNMIIDLYPIDTESSGLDVTRYTIPTWGTSSSSGIIQVPTGATAGNDAWRMFELGIGPKNVYDIISLFESTTSYENFWTDIDKYSITFRSNTNTSSKTLWRKLSCYDSVYPIRQITFKNQLGGWDYFNFKEKSTRKIVSEKTNYKKPLDPTRTIYVNQNLKQVNTINVKYEEEFTASTEWLTEDEYNFLNELILSEDIYVIEGLFKKPIQITNTEFEFKTFQNQDIYILNITYKYSFDRLA